MSLDKLFGKKLKKLAFLQRGGYSKMTFDDLKFYYRSKNVDYEAYGNQGPCRFQEYGFEYDHNITDTWMIFKNKAGKKALVIYVSVPTFDYGDREWDSYRKLFLIPESDSMIGFLIRGGYEIAEILTYQDIHCADKKTERLLNEVVKYLQ